MERDADSWKLSHRDLLFYFGRDRMSINFNEQGNIFLHVSSVNLLKTNIKGLRILLFGAISKQVDELDGNVTVWIAF